MKPRIVMLLVLTFLGVESFAQQVWSLPTRLTTEDANYIHPTIADGFGWLNNQEELMAFSRDGKDICLLSTTSLGSSWSDRLRLITTDSADNDFPSMIRPRSYPSRDDAMLVWQGRRNGNLEILYSRFTQNQWSAPQPITNNSIDDKYPHVGFRDSIYYSVWEQDGKIMFSQFLQNAWSLPQLVSLPNDTVNHLPQVSTQFRPTFGNTPFVVWQRRRDNSRMSSIMSAYRNGLVWSNPDTLVGDKDNKRPRFFKYNYQTMLTWDRRVDTTVSVYGGYISIQNSKGRITGNSPLNSSVVSSQNSSVNGYMIVVNSPLDFFYAVAAWESPRLDSIGVGVRPYGPYGRAQLSPSGATSNRNPTASQGISLMQSGWYVRFWVVWEAFVRSKWQLYGSNILVHVDDVDDRSDTPKSFTLFQNYPNPFNPTTRIEYAIPKTSCVSLKVFDLLGREVATLVDEMQDVGLKTVEFDASGLASGPYFYRLKTNGYVSTKKLLVLR